MVFSEYQAGQFFDEFFDTNNQPRPSALVLTERLESLPTEILLQKQQMAEASLLKMGLTFNVYGHEEGVEKIFPFDIIPRIIAAREWEQIERGLKQRVKALNCFIEDIYNEQKILSDNVIPAELILANKGFCKECKGLKPPGGVWIHISGSDIIRNKDGKFYVLEDNLRCPSGVSYVLKNRQIMKQTFPRAFDAMQVRSVDAYPNMLLETLEDARPEHVEFPTVILLTPGMFNSAYFEHAFLAQQMGIHLVEGRDLVVNEDKVYMRTTKGFRRVDVIYRRIDDEFLDPMAFRSDSLLGVPGLMQAYKAGNVTLANAPGTGIADDKAIYAYVEKMIRYYLDEDAILHNVPTYLCHDPTDCAYVLEHLSSLVVKPVDGSGGHGVVVGSSATTEELEDLMAAIIDQPEKFIAQPIVQLSRAPTFIGNECEGRHVDFRPFTLYGKQIQVIPGGLTRVALKKDSLIVNSCQGGGSKDTWIVEDVPAENIKPLLKEYRKNYAKSRS